jgi:ABC-type oligopeptide transport system substrate-binding subunit
VSTQLASYFFFLNTRVAPFEDVRLRRAVSSAFDRESFAPLLGRKAETTCRILPPNLPGHRRTCRTSRGS